MEGFNGLHILVLIVSITIILILLSFLLRTKDTYRNGKKSPGKGPHNDRPVKKCPLCGEALKPGETVHSVLYPGKPDSLMEIYGCHYCEGSGKNRRFCPVCKKELSDDGFVIARVFKKPEKTHVHVLGCTGCYSGRSKTGT